LLENSEELIRLGLKPTEIIDGYNLATQKILEEFLPSVVVDEVKDLTNVSEIRKPIRTALMSKQYGNEDFLADLVIKAALSVYNRESGHFNVDNVRVCKILGCGIESSQVINGMIFKKAVEGDVKSMKNAKVVCYTCPVDVQATETKGTVLIKTAEELKNFSKGEENVLEAQIKAIADSGAKVIVSGGKYGDLALHYINKFGMMAVRLQSKFDLRRLCQTVGATALTKLIAPTAEELGSIDAAFIDEIGGTSVVVFEQDSKSTKISTIVIRGSTDNLMDDIERAMNDGLNTFKVLTRDGRLVAGAGACEIELARKITDYAETLPGLEQYAVGKFAEALQSLPVIIAQNGGINQQDILSLLLSSHQEGRHADGVDIGSDSAAVQNSLTNLILDLYLTKYWGVKYASQVTSTILQVDQIICSKPAGGPKPPQQQGHWDQD
ncbi:T-complex protein 1 subunit theta-like protein, partial [Euroglyphus maynei]